MYIYFYKSYQTKPKMTIHGDLYYESKEYETRLTERKPGDLSDELKAALGIPLVSIMNIIIILILISNKKILN
jgi:hypothetical protein